MDPDAALAEIRQLAPAIADGTADEHDEMRLAELVCSLDEMRLAELVCSLDEWISGGGFLPAAWQVT